MQFNIRHHIAQLLEYLWTVPAHRAKWIEFSKLEETGKYLKFMNLIANDLIYLLDEGLNKLPEIREIEVWPLALLWIDFETFTSLPLYCMCSLFFKKIKKNTSTSFYVPELEERHSSLGTAE